jgi:TolA-binding protein
VRFAPEEGGEPRVLGVGERASHCAPPAPAPEQALDEAGRRVHRALALARKGSEDIARAEAILAEYLEKQPKGAYAEEALYVLVLVKRRMGKQAEAARLARSFVERFPSTARAGELRRWLAGQPRP